MNAYVQDVLRQPECMKKALDGYLSGDTLNMLDEIASLRYKRILMTGMGSSHFSSLNAQTFLNQRGFMANVKSAGQLFYYERELLNTDTLLVLVSQSGQSAEILRLLDVLPEGCTVVALTNNRDSELARKAQYALFMDVEDEVAASTRTYLASIILLDLLAVSLAGERDQRFLNGLHVALASLESYLSRFEEYYDAIRAFLKDADYLCLMGRGHSLTTVHSGGLFIREAAKLPATDFDSAEFRHGPFEIVQPDFHSVVFAPNGPTYELNCQLAKDIADRGGKALLVTNRSTKMDHERILVMEEAEVPEMLVPICEIAPVQLSIAALAESHGIDPGTFRWASKVTTKE